MVVQLRVARTGVVVTELGRHEPAVHIDLTDTVGTATGVGGVIFKEAHRITDRLFMRGFNGPARVIPPEPTAGRRT